jgi:nucleotide-binding universal stress UspA family protein
MSATATSAATLGMTLRFDTIMIGMDFSRPAIDTAEWLAMALAPEARLILAHAVESSARPSFLVAETLPAEALASDARAQAEDELSEAARQIGRNVVTSEVRVGRPHDVITQLAVEYRADMIAVGPHGHREHESRLIGTTADNVLRSAPIPVLIGARTDLHRRSHVVAAVTEGAANAVLRWADLAAERLDGRLTVLHAIEPAAYRHLATAAATHARGEAGVERAEVDGERRWQALRWVREGAAAGIEPSRLDPVVQEGPAAETIVRIAAREHAALIVLGRHQTPRALPVMLGRTVRHVLHQARSAVLVVPGR